MIVTNFEEFMGIFNPQIKKDSRQWILFRNKTQQLEELFSKIDFSKPITDLDVSNVFKCFDIQSRTVFYHIKKLACDILKFGGFSYKIIMKFWKTEYLDVYYENDFETEFFGSWNELKATILAIEEYNTRIDLDRALVFCGLIWCGFENTAISNICIEHLSYENMSILRVKDNKEMAIPKDLFLRIKSRANGQKQGYIFQGRNGKTIGSSTVTKCLENLNRYRDEVGKTFSTQNILLSGLFDRTHNGTESFNRYDDSLYIKYKGWVEHYRR